MWNFAAFAIFIFIYLFSFIRVCTPRFILFTKFTYFKFVQSDFVVD